MPVPPRAAQTAARLALALKREGYAGGTDTGFRRARQLARGSDVPERDLVTMRNWFARHGPAAANGGTSYPGWKKFRRTPRSERERAKSQFRGAVAWLLWGGDPAYRWIRSMFRETGWPKI